MTTDYPKKKKLIYKPEERRNIEDHKGDGEMISGRKEQAKGSYS